ncbi:hypothetical protein MPTK1_8g00680 [Marchantia polymorpha subsp. ruderalis]|uniref:Major facilitator superfamily (MFS) profile domain-containing protein n=1 Tax=Marchantia polymorpha TaxID=3197 RepID=A0A2R6WLD4_MARPO|nr:hypothetical protein MARPO_0077s0007 [Marchantia polymorpha]BBN18213.1 hypothetical protein Mp_8g00680 [Marchantia polymorpha subsp. ruderalis]|eukprot:PTQ34674.1 hypothetical protein MARPO_0077s0007 [Marchantia polymorpha]
MKILQGLTVSLVLINLAAILEKADESLLPAVYKEVGQAFNASPSELGTLTFIRALVQAISSPLAGILAMRYYRPSVIGIGTLFWGLSTAAVAASQTFVHCALSRAINGIGLAIVIPALQSYIADSYLEGTRGVAFGWLNLVGSVGGIGGNMLATIMAGNTYGGISGWRVAFLLMAVCSSLIGWLVHTLVLDPKKPPSKVFNSVRSISGRDRHHYGETSEDVPLVESLSRPSSSDSLFRMLEEETMVKNLHGAWRDAWVAVRSVLKVRSFQIIVLQGIVGSLPWTAMVFFTMWLELIGFGHKGAASLMGIFSGGCAIGALFGGWMGDIAEKKYPGSGRIMCAQFSSFSGIPFSCILLLVLPQDPQYYVLFAITFLLMGLCVSWCQACANNPIFADVVPEQNRTMIYAFDRALEGSFAAMAAPIVGLLAENVFGYRAHHVIADSGSPIEAQALSRGLCTVMAIPFGLCCFCYTFLYGTYQRDKDEARGHIQYPKFDSSVDDLTSIKFVSD